MRIVRDDAGEYQAGRTYVDITPCYAIKDTVEITDEEWVLIVTWFMDSEYYMNEFPQCLRELIELKNK